MGGADTPIPVTNMTTYPLYMVALHRLAKYGKADIYSKSGRLLQFDLANHGPFAEKWSGLKDVVRVTIIYNERRPQIVL